MRLFTAAAFSLAAFCGAAPTVSFAISANETVELASQGKYEELRLGLESMAAKGTLRTRDLHALCFAYSKTKRYTKLFSCLDGLSANIAKGDTRTRLFGLDDATPALYLMRAEAHMDLGAYAAAVADGEKTIAWIREEGDGETDMELNALSIMAMASALAGDRATADKYVQELEAVSTFTLRGSNYVSAKAMALARAYMAMGEYEKTLNAIERDKLFTFHAFMDRLVSGAVFSGESNWAWQELPRAFMVNRALRGVGQKAQARSGYDRLLAMPQVKDNGEIYWLILFERALLASEEGQADQAIEFYKKAIDVIEMHRSNISTEGSKIGFVGDKQGVYEKLIEALYAKGLQSEAFEYIERSKSRALVDMLASKSVGTFQSHSADTLVAAKNFEAAEEELLAQIPITAGEGKSGQRSVAAQALASVRQASPELSTLLSVSSIDTKRLAEMVPAGEAILQYYYQGSNLYVSVYSNRLIKMTRLDATGLDADIRQFRDDIDKESPGALTLSRKLYDRLVRPIEASLKAHTRLLIIPHGSLHYLPFSALSDSQSYLLERYSLRTLPSASVMPYLKAGSQGNAGTMLVLGNPDLGDSRHDLPSAQAEAERIATKTAQPKLLVRSQATETSLRSLAAAYARLHIASHGIFDQKKPLESALLLTKDADNDGKLTVSELYAMRLNADLVTLSACETGLGQVNSGDDVVGLTRGFLYAGTRSVVASLWQVDDEATSHLMVKFYEEMGVKNKADALRAAQLEVKKRYAHPYYWSAFYLTGSAQ